MRNTLSMSQVSHLDINVAILHKENKTLDTRIAHILSHLHPPPNSNTNLGHSQHTREKSRVRNRATTKQQYNRRICAIPAGTILAHTHTQHGTTSQESTLRDYGFIGVAVWVVLVLLLS